MQTVAAMYPSQYRGYMLAWKEAYAANPEYFNDSGFKWLAKHAKRVGGSYKTSNGMIFRVFFPIYVEPELPTSMLDVFNDAQYTVDASKQVVTDRHGRHISAGKAYQQLAKKSGKSEETIKSVMETYAEVFGSSGAMLLCVSRHPYDIAGMSTGRAWKSCHTVGGTTLRDKRVYVREKAKYDRMMSDHGAELEAKYAELSAEYRNQKAAYIDAVSEWNGVLKSLDDVLENEADGIVDRVLSDEILQVLKGFTKAGRAEVSGFFVTAVQDTLKQLGSALVAMHLEELANDEANRVFTQIKGDALPPEYTRWFSCALDDAAPEEYFNGVITRKVSELILKEALTCARKQPEILASLIPVGISLADADSKMRIAAKTRNEIGVQLVEPKLRVEPAGQLVRYVKQDVVTGSVIAYVIKPKAELLTSLERTKRVAPNLAELLEKKFNRSNSDPLFAPMARVILRSANRRYLRAGTVYGFSELPTIRRQFGEMVHTLTVALNKARKRDYGMLEPSVHEYNDDVDTTYNEGTMFGHTKLEDQRHYVSSLGLRKDYSDYDDSDFENEFGYNKRDFIDNLLDYVVRRIQAARPKPVFRNEIEEKETLARDIVTRAATEPLSNLVNYVSSLLVQVGAPVYRIGHAYLPVRYLIAKVCNGDSNPLDYADADDPESLAHYIPQGMNLYGLDSLPDWRLFETHMEENYISSGDDPDHAYAKSLRDLLLAARDFPPGITPKNLVGHIIEQDAYAKHIPDMIANNVSPLDQFKLIMLDVYNTALNWEPVAEYIPPHVRSYLSENY